MYAFLFVITYLGWQYQQWKQLLQKQTIVLLVIGIPLFGFIIEIIQGTCTATRYFDWWDALANTLGAFVAILLIQLIKTFHFFEKL